MSDPFERAKAIRKGELDFEMPSYDELKGWIQRCPMTWLPGLLSQVVVCSLERNVFACGPNNYSPLILFVERQAAGHQSPAHGTLREDT